jgi:hypothetical protein
MSDFDFDRMGDFLHFDPWMILAFVTVAILGLVIGYKIRITTNMDRASDFITMSVVGICAAVFVIDQMFGLIDTSVIWYVLFLMFLGVGHIFGSRVVNRDQLMFIHFHDDHGMPAIEEVDGVYFDHPEYGMCMSPDNNRDLYRQLVKGEYHRVISVPDEPFEPNIVYRGYDAVIIEDIKTKMVNGVPRTTVWVAQGKQIPRIQLLRDMKTVDSLNKVVAEVTAEIAKVESETIPTMARITADQLIAMVRKNPLIGLLGRYNAKEKEEQ